MKIRLLAALPALLLCALFPAGRAAAQEKPQALHIGDFHVWVETDTLGVDRSFAIVMPDSQAGDGAVAWACEGTELVPVLRLYGYTYDGGRRRVAWRFDGDAPDTMTLQGVDSTRMWFPGPGDAAPFTARARTASRLSIRVLGEPPSAADTVYTYSLAEADSALGRVGCGADPARPGRRAGRESLEDLSGWPFVGGDGQLTDEIAALGKYPEFLNRTQTARYLQRNFPPLLRDAGVSGEVEVTFRVLEDGQVDTTSIRITRSTDERFHPPAVGAVRQMRFNAAILRGNPVKTWLTLPIAFRTEGGGGPYRPLFMLDSAQVAARVTQLQQLLDAEVAANPSLPGELLHVHVPQMGIEVSLASGVFDRASGRPLQGHYVFRVASVTKTFTAAAILRLMEEGRLRLDESIARYLPREYTDRLRADGYDVNAITIRHLLTHTSGIHDYATDERYHPAVLADPTHRWTRLEQVDSAMAWGEPRFAPGRGYHYSDTGYILLGEIIEQRSRRPLAQAYRDLLKFDRLRLDETWLESLEPAPGGVELSHPYFGEMDAVGIDPSVDLYGGGGLVSSVEDLARFYHEMWLGEVFEDHYPTLLLMRTVPLTNENAPGGPYAMGLQRRTIAGTVCWGHTGFWGTAVYTCPELGLTIARHTNQAEPGDTFVFQDLFERIVAILWPPP